MHKRNVSLSFRLLTFEISDKIVDAIYKYLNNYNSQVILINNKLTINN